MSLIYKKNLSEPSKQKYFDYSCPESDRHSYIIQKAFETNANKET